MSEAQEYINSLQDERNKLLKRILHNCIGELLTVRYKDKIKYFSNL
jgi:hypothetical protein